MQLFDLLHRGQGKGSFPLSSEKQQLQCGNAVPFLCTVPALTGGASLRVLPP